MRLQRLASIATALALLSGLYAASVALAYLPSYAPDGRTITVTITRLEPEAAQLGRYRITPAIPLGTTPVLYIDTPLIETPRIWQGETGYLPLREGQTYTLTITPQSLHTGERNWALPWDIRPPGEPLTLKQARALETPRNIPALLLAAPEPGGWPYPLALAAILLLTWRKKPPKSTVIWLLLAWALLGSGIYAGGYLNPRSGIAVPPFPLN